MSDSPLQKWRNEFHVYDQAVDVVSCWETALGHIYSDVFNDYYFERFPSIPSDDTEDDLTPDFTVFFNDEYGIIGEVKRTFPDNDVAFNKELDQIANYDSDLEIRTGNDDRVAPETCDIILIISGSSAPQIGTRIKDRLGPARQFQIDRNIVLLRYQYNSDATLSRYEFQRVTQLDHEFRDTSLPDDISLSSLLGEEGDYDTMKVYPKHFTPLKARKPLCNDQPPEPYLASILWHKVFPEFLSDEDYRRWRTGSAQKTIEFTQPATEITDTLNDYMHEGQARRRWVVAALDFLDTANLANRDSGHYKVRFRDLVQDVGEGFQDGAEMLQQSKELAYMLINRHCKYADHDDDDDDSGEQQGLDEFF
jgi:hypothetical protein